ncbi:MAG TPA: hypothetical protein PLI09_00715 [Candidatus Hydrogenedentes bacterium]|nr:hypothetical protein [Candidatus Hydrogenedentota bacterium]
MQAVATIDYSQKMRMKALFALLTSSARVTVLRVFLLDPLRSYYQRQIEMATGLPIRAIQRELERLSSVGLIYRRAEGNRTYYQVDMNFPLFPELRGMILKASDDVDALRGTLALEDAVQLLFLADTRDRVLAVIRSGRRVTLPSKGPLALEVMSNEEFLRALGERKEQLDPFLVRGLDLLGRREDVLWRHIEAAGYNVQKGEGVP